MLLLIPARNNRHQRNYFCNTFHPSSAGAASSSSQILSLPHSTEQRSSTQLISNHHPSITTFLRSPVLLIVRININSSASAASSSSQIVFFLATRNNGHQGNYSRSIIHTSPHLYSRAVLLTLILPQALHHPAIAIIKSPTTPLQTTPPKPSGTRPLKTSTSSVPSRGRAAKVKINCSAHHQTTDQSHRQIARAKATIAIALDRARTPINFRTSPSLPSTYSEFLN